MVHFNFVVSDADAENIFSAVRDQVSEMDALIIQAIADRLPSEKEPADKIAAYRAQKDYYINLISRMTNQQVGD